MALAEFRKKMPAGDIGRIINSYIFNGHNDSVEYQRKFRINLYAQLRKEFYFYQSMTLGENGWIYRVDCAMCEDPLYLYIEYDHEARGKYLKNACSWIEDCYNNKFPIATMVTINESTEKPEILPDSIITPCCGNPRMLLTKLFLLFSLLHL